MDELDERILSQALDIHDWIKQSHIARSKTSQFDKQLPEVPVYTREESVVSRQIKRVLRKLRGESVLELSEISIFCLADRGLFWGGWIDVPRISDKVNGLVLPFHGWVAGRASRVTSIQVIINNELFAKIPVNVQRPDVAKAYLLLGNDCTYGYATSLDLKGLPNTITLQLKADFSGSQSAKFGEIKISKYE